MKITANARRAAIAFAALSGCLLSGHATAVERGLYVGATLGQSASGLRSSNINYTERNAGYQLLAGFRPLKLLAVELSYVNLGDASSGSVSARTTAVSGFVLGFLPLPLVDIYGKVGLASWRTQASAPTLSWRPSGSDLALGAGVQLHFGALAARLEYAAFDAPEASKPTLLSLGLTYTFF
jgi:hypothetical protein